MIDADERKHFSETFKNYRYYNSAALSKWTASEFLRRSRQVAKYCEVCGFGVLVVMMLLLTR